MARTISWRWNTVAVAGALFAAACSSGNTGTLPNDEGPGGNLGSSSGTSGGDDGASSGTGGGTGTGVTGPTGPAGDDGASDDANVADDASSASDDGGDDATLAADSSVHDAGIHDAGTTRDAGTHDAGTHDAGGTPPVDASTHDAGTSSDAGDALAAARAQCVQIINADRATLSPASPPLTEDTAEEACVDGQAMADFTANTAHSAFGKCKESAQDECPNWPGPPSAIMTKCLAQMWAEGPPAAGQDNHWLNMSNAQYKKVACGFYQTPSGNWWATQDFY
jgi:hypothetical protein